MSYVLVYESESVFNLVKISPFFPIILCIRQQVASTTESLNAILFNPHSCLYRVVILANFTGYCPPGPRYMWGSSMSIDMTCTINTSHQAATCSRAEGMTCIAFVVKGSVQTGNVVPHRIKKFKMSVSQICTVYIASFMRRRGRERPCVTVS